jgi:hypothetical protein
VAPSAVAKPLKAISMAASMEVRRRARISS